MALTQTQFDNLVTLLKSEYFEDIQNGMTLVETLIDSGVIEEEEFIRIIEEVTGGIILNDEEYVECVDHLNTISEISGVSPPRMTSLFPCRFLTHYLQENVIHRITLNSMSYLFYKHRYELSFFMGLWTLGAFAKWHDGFTNITYIQMESQDFLDRRFLPMNTMINSLCNLKHLTHLDFRDCDMDEVPSDIGALTTLTKLDLSENQITTLPQSIGNLNGLTDLWLEKNWLETLPEVIYSLPNLQNLYLTDNLIPDSEHMHIRNRLPNCDIVF